MTRAGENSGGARRAPRCAKAGPPTRAEYDAARPFHKGFMAYQFGGLPGSAIPGVDLCPFEAGTHDHAAFEAGVRRAEFDAEARNDA